MSAGRASGRAPTRTSSSTWAGATRAPAAGFAEVVFPPFLVDAPGEGARERSEGDAAGAVGAAGAAGAVPPRLVLRRGVTGALDLAAWWKQACKGRAAQRRHVTVSLLAEDRQTVVLTWRFRQARPVSLSYSPLRAAEGGVLMETLELAFDSVEIG